MNMTSIGIADFKGCHRSNIMSCLLFQAGLFRKEKKNSVFARYSIKNDLHF